MPTIWSSFVNNGDILRTSVCLGEQDATEKEKEKLLANVTVY